MAEATGYVGTARDFRWYRYRGTKENYEVANGRIVPVKGTRAEGYLPLEDPDLMFSFARLANQGKPTENKVLKWIEKYGLLHLEDDQDESGTQGTERPDISNPQQKPVFVEHVSREAKQMASVLNLYADILHGDYDEFTTRMKVISERQKDWRSIIQIPEWVWVDDNLDDWGGRYVRPPGSPKVAARDRDLDAWLLEESGLTRDGRVGSHFLDDFPLPLGASFLFESFLSWKLEPVSLSLDADWSNEGYRPRASLDCHDLITAIYVQLMELVTSGRPIERCQRESCRLPFTFERENRKKFCNSTCRSSAR